MEKFFKSVDNFLDDNTTPKPKFQTPNPEI